MGGAEDGGEPLLLCREWLSANLRGEGLRTQPPDRDGACDRLAESVAIVRETHPCRKLSRVLPAIGEDDELSRLAGGRGCDVSKKRVREHLRDLLEAGPKSAHGGSDLAARPVGIATRTASRIRLARAVASGRIRRVHCGHVVEVAWAAECDLAVGGRETRSAPGPRDAVLCPLRRCWRHAGGPGPKDRVPEVVAIHRGRIWRRLKVRMVRAEVPLVRIQPCVSAVAAEEDVTAGLAVEQLEHA